MHFSNIDRLLQTYCQNANLYELEVRLGRFETLGDGKRVFTSSIPESDFHRLLAYHKDKFTAEYSDVNQRISGKVRYEEDRSIHKEAVDREDVEELDIRICLSREKVNRINQETNSSMFHIIGCTRRKKRTSFKVTDDLRLDFTQVFMMRGDVLDGPVITYEVELEVTKPTKLRNLESGITKLVQMWQQTFYILTKSDIMHIDTSFKQLCGINRVEQFAGAQPRTMQIEDLHSLASQPYAITHKIDGCRTYLYVHDTGAVILVTCSPKRRYQQIAVINKSFAKTLLDGEKTTSKFYAFDTIFFKGIDLRDNDEFSDLKSRTHLAQEVCDALPPDLIFVKKYYYSTTMQEMVKNAKILLDSPSPYTLDGLISVPSCERYPKHKYWKGLLKWKPSITIDFRVKDSTLYVNSTYGNEIEFKPKSQPKVNMLLKAFVPQDLIDGEIYECQYDSVLQSFIPIRHRKDKPSPNFIHVALDNFHAIHNPVTISLLFDEEYNPSTPNEPPRKEQYNISVKDALSILTTPSTGTMDAPTYYPVCDIEPCINIETVTVAAETVEESAEGREGEEESSMDSEVEDSSKRSIEEEEEELEEGEKVEEEVKRRKRQPPVYLLGRPLRSWKLSELRTECGNRGLDLTGKKNDLISKLQTNIEN